MPRPPRPTPRRFFTVLAAVLSLAFFSTARGDEPAARSGKESAAAPAVAPEAGTIAFTQETLDNGLRVIYAPLHQAPVVHVRVLYHVGSRDEKPDRQGFAHMFEHMMFRGSAHVKPEEHMKLIGMVGGYSNAFTSFDDTVYVNTIPSNQLEMALYLEADRMASFKVSEDIFKTERKVVAEEWRMGENRPYGTMYQDFLKTAFVNHSYRWTPIGNMEHLKAAQVNELQDFFNTYYLPNNAILVIAGDFETGAAKQMARKYFGWIPKGPEVKREIPAEPEQQALRTSITPQRVPLPAVLIGYHTPAYASDDHYGLSLLGDILSAGRSGRLNELLVNNEKPLCVNVGASDMTLEDAGMFLVHATVLNGKSADEVQKAVEAALADVRDKGVTEEELRKVKTQVKVARVKGREEAEQLASQLGDEALFGLDPNRVNSELAKIEAVTPADIQKLAAKYLKPQEETVLHVTPDPLGKAARAAATQADATINAPVAPASRPVQTRAIAFPPGYPTTAPVAVAAATPEFKKGQELTVDGLKLIVMSDNRLPLAGFTVTMRRGSHSDPRGKEGVASLTAEMVRRGTQAQTYAELNEDLESHGITLAFADAGDATYFNGSCTSEGLGHAVERAHEVLTRPRFDAAEFERVKTQTLNGLLQAQETPTTVANWELNKMLWGDSAVGRFATPASVARITLDDVKAFYDTYYRPNDALVVFSGDVTAEKAKELAGKVVAGWADRKPAEVPAVDYTLKVADDSASAGTSGGASSAAPKYKITLVDRPGGAGVTIHMAIRAYDRASDDKYAGSLASQILTAGIDSRLGKYVRAEKGLVYGIHGVFTPSRHSGTFGVSTETRPDAAAETIVAAFKVLDEMKAADVTPQELSEAKLRVSGSMVMSMQTIGSQAAVRVDGILNGYPIDYYDKYPARIGAVTADQVREVMNKYVKDAQMPIVVVAPAAAVKEQLEKIGDVKVVPMPARREGATQPTTREMMKPAA